MRRITRYVVVDLLAVFTVTLAAITTLMILGVVVAQGLKEGLGLGPILRMVPYVVPMSLQISVPATMLMAASSVYGRMSADNEIVAIKSMGISPFTLLFPSLVLAFVVSLVAVWINDIAASWGRTGMYRVVVESVEEVAYRMLKTQRAYQSQMFSINVKDVQGRTLVQPVIQIRASGGGRTRLITASSAELHSDPENNVLRVDLKNLIFDEGDVSAASDADTIEIPLDGATRKGDSSDSPSLIPLRRIAAELRAQREVTERFEEQASTAAAFQMMTGDFSGLSDARAWERRRSEMEGQRSRLDRLKLEPWRRWASGFSCFFFVLVGAPLAIQMKTANFFTSFAACFLPILLVYFPLLAFAVGRCKDGVMPPYTVWLGNVVLSLAGAWMVRRAIRY
jgi:lipopolysaccharide export system permease protein